MFGFIFSGRNITHLQFLEYFFSLSLFLKVQEKFELVSLL